VNAPVLDRRVRKSRRQLHDALVNLILERGWEEVSVIDVCARADVGRSTFYLHFADKEDLLLSGFDELHEALHVNTATSAAGSFAFIEPLLVHARDNTRLMRALAGRKSGQAVQRRFRDVLNGMVSDELAALKVSAALRPQLARFLSGGLIDLVFDWLESPRSVEPASLAALFRRLSDAAVAATRHG
jgi:AcrR family transcriptional regulator